MEEMLTYILERYAEKTEKQTNRNSDMQKKAYMNGKADGLRLAKDLLCMLNEHRHSLGNRCVEAR